MPFSVNWRQTILACGRWTRQGRLPWTLTYSVGSSQSKENVNTSS